MKAGFYAADITPAIGMERPGGYEKIYHQAIHDPLKARAAVFEDGDEVIAFVGVDTCALPHTGRLGDVVRREVERRIGIRGDHIMIAASHTHSGGPLDGRLPVEFADAPPLVQEILLHHSPGVDPLYFDWVCQQIVSAICEAHHRRVAAQLSVGSGIEAQVLFNRRFKMRNDRVYTHPGKGNPDIVGPAGPVDPAVGVLGAWDARGDMLGCIVNYSSHCTCFSLNTVSADYVYYVEQTIQSVMGREAVVVFLPGAAGDVTQVNNLSLAQQDFGEKITEKVGRCVGAEAIKVLALAERGELTPLAAANTALPIPRRRPNPARLAASRALVEAGMRTGEHGTEWTFAKELVVLEYLLSIEPIVSVEVQALQVGPAIFLANPAEYFAESGLAIKAASPFPFTFIVTVANGYLGYVPPGAAFEPTGGGYETVMASISNLVIEAADQIAAASLKLANQLTPGATPEPLAVKQPGTPWSYGILGPDRE